MTDILTGWGWDNPTDDIWNLINDSIGYESATVQTYQQIGGVYALHDGAVASWAWVYGAPYNDDPTYDWQNFDIPDRYNPCCAYDDYNNPIPWYDPYDSWTPLPPYGSYFSNADFCLYIQPGVYAISRLSLAR